MTFCESCLAARGSFTKTGCLVSTSLGQHERIFGRKLMVGCAGRCDGIGETAPTEAQTKMCKHSFATICSYDTYITYIIYIFNFDLCSPFSSRKAHHLSHHPIGNFSHSTFDFSATNNDMQQHLAIHSDIHIIRTYSTSPHVATHKIHGDKAAHNTLWHISTKVDWKKDLPHGPWFLCNIRSTAPWTSMNTTCNIDIVIVQPLCIWANQQWQKPPIEFCEAEIQYTKHFQLTKFTSYSGYSRYSGYRWQSSQTQHLSFSRTTESHGNLAWRHGVCCNSVTRVVAL